MNACHKFPQAKVVSLNCLSKEEKGEEIDNSHIFDD